jgi:uncharacterized glyoxalase superfamily protein PhnB
MTYALIPEGFTLKKVTKQQQDAVNRHRRHENVEALINNPEIIKQIIIVVAGYYTARAGVEAIDELKKLGATIPKAVEDTYTKKRPVRVTDDFGMAVSIEDIVDFAIKEFTGE